ncbi:MAG: hypothetical protein K6A80_07015 [Saccharofermentans sp.]|nr:hypothetical protein [Saccharofermentans sp.]
MKNNPETKSELTFELEEELEMERSADGGQVTLLIKHDYFSSDNEHGRALLKSFLGTVLDTQNVGTIILTDSGVKILADGSPCLAVLNDIININMPRVLCCSDSLSFYGTACPDFAEAVSSRVIFIEIMESVNLITAE